MLLCTSLLIYLQGTKLLIYRSAPYATTELRPAQLLLGRNIKTRLDLIKPNGREVNTKLHYSNSWLALPRNKKIIQEIAMKWEINEEVTSPSLNPVRFS